MSPRRARQPRGPVDPERSRRARESQRIGKAEQQRGMDLLAWLQAEVYTIGTTRRKGDYQGTMQTPGLSDYLFFLRPKGERGWRAAWWESKARSGRLSPAQRKFRELVLMSGWPHIVGDTDALIAWLCDQGELRPDQIPHYRAPNQEKPQC